MGGGGCDPKKNRDISTHWETQQGLRFRSLISVQRSELCTLGLVLSGGSTNGKRIMGGGGGHISLMDLTVLVQRHGLMH